ncbi:DUF4336 domain-containing protein [Methylobacterium dankookense]|uniref:DUF4336 domain-containing protein n=1 Tax=Methylobacterium dankookense TaxID=560405 RepID=A0A564FX23_9HYPH|nr:DUF4336 domain-containing protein [Methylobacterium dankookense]GJD57927.1 hypothetical protein IFDJLNFL_3840 [Methylobacterium dankookense]VUF12288.1 hypothetical protein MTDSW087_01977 [Methylobacterium dankookense]
MQPITYPPLDTLKPVAPDLWIVDSGPLHVLGLLPLPVRMCVVRLTDGTVWLHSPTRYDPDLHRAILRIGPIRHLVAPNVAHWSFLAAWQRHCPEAVSWAAPNLRRRGPVRRAGLRLDRDLGAAAPADWAEDIAQAVMPGGFGFREVAFFHRASRSLILTDLVVNLEPERLPWPMRLPARLAGITAPDGRAPAYLRLVVRLRRAEAARAAATLLALEPERVLFAHGAWFARDGAAALRRSWRWLGV